MKETHFNEQMVNDTHEEVHIFFWTQERCSKAASLFESKSVLSDIEEVVEEHSGREFEKKKWQKYFYKGSILESAKGLELYW